MKIGFVGGGTGGHFYPLISVAEKLNTHPEKPELYYFGPSPYSVELLARNNITYVYCPAGKLRRYFSFQNVLDLFKIIGGVITAIFKLYWYYPDVIFSKGGYTSVPILTAARILRIPVVIHESDTSPGRANKYAKKFARYIGISWAESAEYFPAEKTALVGIPIRTDILHPPEDPSAFLGIPNDMPLVYVTGGSLGAERINTLILNSLNELLPHMRVFHQCGEANLETVRKIARELLVDTPELLNRYYVAGNLDGTTISAVLKMCHIVITRAGSTSLFEIAMYNKPAIIIPIPEEISHDQRKNAYAYARTGAGEVIEEKNLTEHLLQVELTNILSEPAIYQKMVAGAQQIHIGDAAQKIADILLSIGHEHGS